MSAQTRAKSTVKRKSTKASRPAPSICWFEIPADNPDRAKKFYSSLFGWKIEKFPGVTDYWHIDTGGADDLSTVD
jgi:predicted enzyme related to lactoylglutathione lyase